MWKKTQQWKPGHSSLRARLFEPSSTPNYLTLFDIVHWKPISLEGGTTPGAQRPQPLCGFSLTCWRF